MDYTYLRNRDLYAKLKVIKNRADSAAKNLEQVLADYPGSDSMADVAVQSKKSIGLLGRISDELGLYKRNLYYYRPQERTYKRIQGISKELFDSHSMNRNHGRNDIKMDMDKDRSSAILGWINCAFDDTEDVLLLVGVLKEINDRKGLYNNYIGDRLWSVIASSIIAILTGIVGLLTGILLA